MKNLISFIFVCFCAISSTFGDSPYSWKIDYAENVRVDHFAYTNSDKFKIRLA